AITALGVKLDETTRERLKSAAQQLDRTPHWLIKQAIYSYLEHLESGARPNELASHASSSNGDEPDSERLEEPAHQPFLEFAESILPQSVQRAAITAAYRRPEPDVVPVLLEQARLPADTAAAANTLAYRLTENLRNQKTAIGRAGLVQGLLQEFSLSSQEGV